MSTTAVNPKCAKCGHEIDGTLGMVLSGRQTYHNTCAPSYVAPAIEDRLRQWAGLFGDSYGNEAALMTEAAAALSRLRAELEREHGRYIRSSRSADTNRKAREAAEASNKVLRDALTEARKMIQTRETIDELGWGKGTSPATRLLAKIDAALAGDRHG